MYRIAAFVAILAGLVSVGAAAVADGTVASSAHDYRDVHFDYFVSGNPSSPRAQHTDFGLVLMGGGGRVAAAFQEIARRAGRGHIVILRAVSDGSYDPDDGDYGRSFSGEWGPVASAETIVFHDRQAAYDARVIAALRGADGIFIAGGDQANYVRYWKGTTVQRLLDDHVAANRPIGGSSAGLAILGHYSYTAFDGGSMESKAALADPFDPGVTLEKDFLHYRFLDRLLTDTHFSARCRLGRLIVFLARLQTDVPGSGVYGVGVDERTAMLVDASGSGRLLEGSEGSAWVVSLPTQTPRLTAGQPLNLARVRVARMDPRSRLALGSGQVTLPVATTILNIVGGRAAEESSASAILRRETVPPDED